jgi:hypothetical protein
MHFDASELEHSQGFHTGIFSVLLLLPGTLLLIFFKNRLNVETSPMCSVDSRNKISIYNAANI